MNRNGASKGALLAAALLLFSPAAAGSSAAAPAAKAAAAAKTVSALSLPATIAVGGQVLVLDKGSSVFLHEGRTYLPLRAASEALGLEAAWDNAAKKLSLQQPSDAGRQALAAKLAARLKAEGRSADGGVKLALTPVPVRFHAFGQEAALPSGQQVFIAKGTLYVPLRFAAELTGASVAWDGKRLRVDIAPEAQAGSGGGAEDGLSGGEDVAAPPAGGASSPAPTASPSPAVPPAGGGGGGWAPPPATPAPSASPAPSAPPGSPAPSPTASPSPGATPTPSPGATPTPSPGATPTPSPSASEEEIHRQARSEADALRGKCRSDLVALALRYSSASTGAEKAKARQEGEAVFAACDAAFERIMSGTRAKLEAGGYSTERLQEYRKEYERELAEGRALLEGLLG
ncbi:Chitinase [Paenibacillus pasadenensis]|uniref:Chitinase n=1 Tax=Paenibacillus pasadenensis TaxID=217090 RepID=A0A2N5NAH9_9BACL|nr:copper amine oxidase N-terminal domain-containing protein [Paenibacillus pasadenensis]PLT47314.1 Chitinase [Paenibacillus pasadenensis]